MCIGSKGKPRFTCQLRISNWIFSIEAAQSSPVSPMNNLHCLWHGAGLDAIKSSVLCQKFDGSTNRETFLYFIKENQGPPWLQRFSDISGQIGDNRIRLLSLFFKKEPSETAPEQSFL